MYKYTVTYLKRIRECTGVRRPTEDKCSQERWPMTVLLTVNSYFVGTLRPWWTKLIKTPWHTVFIQLNSALDKMPQIEAKLPINTALAYLRIIEKNLVQLGNLHHPDIYDLDRQLSLTFLLSHSRLRACVGGEWRSRKERGRKPEQRKSKRLRWDLWCGDLLLFTPP